MNGQRNTASQGETLMPPDEDRRLRTRLHRLIVDNAYDHPGELGFLSLLDGALRRGAFQAGLAED